MGQSGLVTLVLMHEFKEILLKTKETLTIVLKTTIVVYHFEWPEKNETKSLIFSGIRSVILPGENKNLKKKKSFLLINTSHYDRISIQLS